MQELATDWSSLCILVFLLGMRHGFDADHLATIDGLSRLNRGRALSRYCGTLFSGGHGLIVLGIALLVGQLSQHWITPAWLNLSGALISILFLLGLGIANLVTVLSTAPGQSVRLISFKGKFFTRILRTNHPAGVAGIGALFALSFDTISQAALFALTASQYGGTTHTLALGLLFVLGMLVTDGLNGWWIAKLIARTDEIAALASRILGAAVACASLLVAALGIAKLMSPSIETWGQDKDLSLGLAVVGAILCSYLCASTYAKMKLRNQFTIDPASSKNLRD